VNAFSVLLRQRIRRDRWTVPIWIVSTGLLALFAAVSIIKTYGDESARSSLVTLVVDQGRAILLLRGLPNGTGNGQFTFFQIFTYLALLAAFMSTFLAVRHSRAEEESGRAELISATPASRIVPTIASLVHGVLANVVLGIAVAFGFIAGGLDLAGSVETGLATAAVGISFLGVGLLVAQFVRTSRGANSVSSGLIGAAFILRGIGDALGTASADHLHMTSAWVSWLSPIGWAQHVDAYGTNDSTALLLNLGLAIVCVAAVFVLEARRDTGASLFAGTAGRQTASPALSSSFGLAWRLQWPTIIGWAIGGASIGALAGGLSGLIKSAVQQAPATMDAINSISPSTGSVDEQLVAVMFELAGVLAAGAAIQCVMRLRQEETGGTAELVLTTPTARVRWFVEYLGVGVIAIVIVLLSAAAVSAGATLATGGPTKLVGDAFLSAAAQIPASLVFLALLALIFILLPGITIGLGWGAYGLLTFVGVFGGIIGAPEWLRNVAPFTHTPVPFGKDIDWSGGIWMLTLSIVAGVVAAFLMRRRALQST
jgi:ABC-2 type transport system permease protein